MKTRSHLLLTLASLVGLGLYALTAMFVPRPEVRHGFIVQGSSLGDAVALAGEAGGIVTHKLGIIQAVAAELTDEQQAALEGRPEVRRVWPDREVYVAGPSCPVTVDRMLVPQGKKLKLAFTNHGDTRMWLEDLQLEWPAANGGLKKIKLDGDIYKRYAPASELVVDGLWDGNLDDRKLDAGKTKSLEIEFDNDVDPVGESYFVEADFGPGEDCVLVFQPPPADCPVFGDPRIEMQNRKIAWALTNAGAADLHLEGLGVRWPATNGDLNKVKLRGDIVKWSTPPDTLAVSDGWDGGPDARKLEPGKTETLEIEFQHDVELFAGLYELEAAFGPDCSASFAGELGGGSGTGGGGVAPADFSTLIGATQLHAQGITGDGVTVAIVDTGVWPAKTVAKNRAGANRILEGYNSIRDETSVAKVRDRSGHGTHVASLIANSEQWETGLFSGVAPDANLLVVQAFDEQGRGSYADAIRAIDWVVQNKDLFGVRVLNLSFSAEPRSYYWDDPLNQAVMATWRAGIAVVASAGNGGPDPMTVGVPGNVPYVITVGAMSDAVTPEEPGDDFLASFSAAGPTVEGFVKPEVVAPGGHLRGIMDKNGKIAKAHPNFHDRGKYFVMSGTSQAAAVTSGVAALLLQAEPGLSPDELKCRLMASARPAVNAQGALAYSVFQQGAGMVHAADALGSSEAGCANQGLDLELDLAGTQHFGGLANRDEQGNYYIMGLDGYLWSGGYLWSEGYLWSGGYLWSEGYLWSGGYLWSEGYAWSDSYPFSTGGYLWSEGLTETMAINTWVPQE